MRIDKFLKNARIIKRRTVGKEACDGGRISINGKVAKAGDRVSVGDVISIRFGEREQKVEVLELLEHAPKEMAATMYKEL
ncbi:MAG: RNA-binding S4 domain-containing protein [Eubacteriaceae bacterium]|jgi:ribosomal 50S subunit-recycling heat shock protein